MSIRPIPTQSEDWHALRRQNVGGSEVAALFGVQSDYALSHYALWHVKAGLAPAPEVGGPRVSWGLYLEQAIAEAAAVENGWTLRKGGYCTDDTTPGMACTLDYEIEASDADRADGRDGIGVLEIKNADWLVWRRKWTDDEPPLHILLQLQHQLACAGREWGMVACLVGGNDLRIYPYRARPKLIADIRARVTAFWQSIREGKPPPVDGSEGATHVLKSLYAESVDGIADLQADNELPEICAGILHAVNARKEAEKRESEFKNRLRAKLGSHLKARAQGFFISVAVTPEKPPITITPEMVGTVLPGRAASQRFTVKELS